MARTKNIIEFEEPRQPVGFDDRTRRVMELRKQVREGTYRADPREVATAILGEWLAISDVVVSDEELPVMETSADRKAVATRFVVAPATPIVEASKAARTA